MTCNVGFLREELEVEVQKLFGDDESAALAACRKINYTAVVDGWNSKVNRSSLPVTFCSFPNLRLNDPSEREIEFHHQLQKS